MTRDNWYRSVHPAGGSQNPPPLCNVLYVRQKTPFTAATKHISCSHFPSLYKFFDRNTRLYHRTARETGNNNIELPTGSQQNANDSIIRCKIISVFTKNASSRSCYIHGHSNVSSSNKNPNIINERFIISFSRTLHNAFYTSMHKHSITAKTQRRSQNMFVFSSLFLWSHTKSRWRCTWHTARSICLPKAYKQTTFAHPTTVNTHIHCYTVAARCFCSSTTTSNGWMKS